MPNHSPCVFDADSRSTLNRSLTCMMLVLGAMCRSQPYAVADDAIVGRDQAVRAFIGTVIDEAGNPVADALVEWGHFRAEQSEREFTFTNADGEYRLDTTRAWQDFRLGVHKSGYGPRWVEGLIPTAEPSVVDFTMPPPKELTGVVVGPEGEPLPGVMVKAQIGQYGDEFGNPPPVVYPSPFPGAPRVATTNQNGEFVIRDVSEVVSIVRDGESESMQVLSDFVQLSFIQNGRYLDNRRYHIGTPVRLQAEPLRRPVTPETTGVLRGDVIDTLTREPITRFRAHWRLGYNSPVEEFVSDDGEFTLSEPYTLGHEYEVEVFADGYAPASANILALAPGEKPRVTIELIPHAPVECEVVDAVSGAPLPGVGVLCGVYYPGLRDVQWYEVRDYHRHYILHHQQYVTTDEVGRATMLEGNEPNSMFIIHPGYARAIIFPEDRAAMMTEDKVLRISLVPECRVRGRILLDPVPGAKFELFLHRTSHEKDEHENFYGDGVVNAAGEFEIERLSAGTYFLQVRLDTLPYEYWETEFKVLDGEHVQLDIGAPVGPHTLSGLAPPFSILQLTPWQAIENKVMFAGYANSEGYFDITGIPEGIYEVRIRVFSGARGTHRWDQQDFVEITGDTEHDFTAVPLLDE